MGGTVHARALNRAAKVLGGKSKLREYLRVSMRSLDEWMAGREKPPTDVFLKTVDIISSAPLPAEGPALEFFQASFAPHERSAVAEAALDAAITATGAEMGNVQLAVPQGLQIVAHRGFERPFLDFYAVVDDSSPASCGVAKKAGTRVVVRDVASDPIFVGTPAEEIMAFSGVRSVQSTPIVGQSGILHGMLNTHCASPRDLARREEEALDRIARRTAFLLEGATT